MSVQQPTSFQVRNNLTEFIQSEFKVEQLDDERITISTPFTYPYDDPIILYLILTSEGIYSINDNGDALNWLNEVNGFEPDRELTHSDRTFWDVNCELYGTRRSEYDRLEIEANMESIGPAVFRLIQTIIHILGPEPR